MTPNALAIGVTTHNFPLLVVEVLRKLLETAGHKVWVYADGREMEQMIHQGRLAGVLDLTPVELCDPKKSADRLTAAALTGISQVVSVGGLGGSPEEADRIGQDLAHKVSAARGPTVVLLPSRSNNAVLTQSLRNWVYPPGLIEEIDASLHDPAFAEAAAVRLLSLLTRQSGQLTPVVRPVD